LKITTLILRVLILLFIFSCKPQDLTSPLTIGPTNNPNALVITGHGFSSAVFYLNSPLNGGYYDTSFHQTIISAGADTDSIQIQVFISFSGASSFIYNDTIPKLYDATDSLLVISKASQKKTYYRPLYINNYMDITSYDNAGGHIKGSISGTYLNPLNNLDSLKIFNGRFSVLRLPDVP